MKIVFALMLTLVASLLLGGCSKSERPADGAVRDQILLLGNGSEPKGLDPHIVTGVTENKIISALIEGLIAYHPTDDNEPEPGVAESWSAHDNYSRWVFRLRPDARWSNGDPVTASDFVYSWRRILTPALGAEYADMLHILEGAEAFHRGQTDDFSTVGVKAVDGQTLEVRLVGPTPYFLGMLKHYSWYPVHPPTIERFGGIAQRGSQWTRPGNYVGNGPFVLAEWALNKVIRVTRNPLYWDSERVRLKEIRFFPIENVTTEETAFRNGQLHVTNSLKSDKIPWYRDNRPDILHIGPYLGTYFYRLNVTRGPLGDARVRLALNLALDRQLIVDTVTLGGQRPAFGYTPDGMRGYSPPQPLSYDPERARALLAEAGFPGGKGFPTFSILFNTLEDHRKIAEAVQQMWRRHLGINVTLTNQEWKVYIDSQVKMDYDLSRAGWIGDYMDPITFLSMWTTNNGNNNTGWTNREFDDLIRRAQRSGSVEEHFSLLHKAETIFMEELPVVPLYWYTRTYLLDPRVQGWHPKLLDNRPYKYIYLEDRGVLPR